MSLYEATKAEYYTEKQMCDICLFLKNYVFGYTMIMGYNSNYIEKKVYELSNKVYRFHTVDVLIEIKQTLMQYYPSYDDFENAFSNMGFSNKNKKYRNSNNRKRMYYLFKEIEEYAQETTGALQRTEIPKIPIDAIREAKGRLLSIMKKGIEMEEINPRLPLSVNGIPEAKNTLRIMETAPVVIVVLNTNGKSPFVQLDVDDRFTEMNDILSIGASIENMLLKAEELNIGTLWIGNTCFAYQELMEYIGVTAELVGAIALGYKAETPAMRPRKKIEDIIVYFD